MFACYTNYKKRNRQRLKEEIKLMDKTIVNQIKKICIEKYILYIHKNIHRIGATIYLEVAKNILHDLNSQLGSITLNKISVKKEIIKEIERSLDKKVLAEVKIYNYKLLLKIIDSEIDSDNDSGDNNDHVVNFHL